MRRDELLHEINEGRMKGKPTRRIIQRLHDLANDGGFVALKRAVDDREVWRHSERMSKTCCCSTDDDDDDDVHTFVTVLHYVHSTYFHCIHGYL